MGMSAVELLALEVTTRARVDRSVAVGFPLHTLLLAEGLLVCFKSQRVTCEFVAKA